MFSILVWTVLLGVLFLVGMLVFLLDRLQTISNVARFGPPKDYMDKLETKRKRRMALEKSKRSASNQLLLSGLSESQNGSNDRQTTGEKPARKSLEGRILWNVLSGKKTSKRTEEEIEGLRAEYRVGLTKHITTLFEEGVADSRDGKNEPPSNIKTIEHGGGELVSWIPLRYSGDLYELGRTAAVDRTEGFILVRRDLESACSYLFKEVGLDEGGIGSKLAADLLSNVKQEDVAKPKKTPVSTEVMDMLDSDNTYDDKVALVRVFSSTDLERIAKVVKGMIKT